MKAAKRRPSKASIDIAPAYRAIAEALLLDQGRARRLVEDLTKAKLDYAAAVLAASSSPSGKAAASALADIEKSIARIAWAERSQPMRRGILRMQRMAETWASEDKLQALGVDADMRKGSAAAAVNQWLNSAPVIHGLLKATMASLKGEERTRAKEALCGEVLPQLYGRYSGKRFTIPRARDLAMMPKNAIPGTAHQAEIS